jgi:hypothetical protein
MPTRDVCFEVDEELLQAFKAWCKDNRFKLKEGFALALKTLLATPQPPPPNPAPQKSLSRLEIEAEIKQIKTELRGLQYLVKHVLGSAPSNQQPVDSNPLPKQTEPNGDLRLPSFMKDNPWIEILRNRCGEES